jgi:hypothetical protein
MISNLDRYKKDLDRLAKDGALLFNAIQAEHFPKEYDAAITESGEDPKEARKSLPLFAQAYQTWYSEAKALIRQLLPDRLDDFVRHYEKPKSRKEITYESYRIEDALLGLTLTKVSGDVVASPKAAISHVHQQFNILRAVRKRFESSLFDIRQLVQADLFDSELEAARELLKKGFLRAAGALAGVVLEKHLGVVAANHDASTKKSHPTISDLNDLLKSSNVLDVPEWRRVQRLGDLRNLCDHNKHRDPTNEEIAELIEGVEKLTKTLF